MKAKIVSCFEVLTIYFAPTYSGSNTVKLELVCMFLCSLLKLAVDELVHAGTRTSQNLPFS